LCYDAYLAQTNIGNPTDRRIDNEEIQHRVLYDRENGYTHRRGGNRLFTVFHLALHIVFGSLSIKEESTMKRVSILVSADQAMTLSVERAERLVRFVADHLDRLAKVKWLPQPKFRTSHVVGCYYAWRQSGQLPDGTPETKRFMAALHEILAGAPVTKMGTNERACHQQLQEALNDMRKACPDSNDLLIAGKMIEPD
jgi:hypothetical protein